MYYYMKKANIILKILIYLIFLSIPICTIFLFSNQAGPQSYGLSDKISAYIAIKWDNVFKLNLSNVNLNLLTTSLYMPTRKLAHITEYATLGLFSFAGMYLLQHRVKLSGIIITILLIILIASCDEINQSYVVQRGSHISDVCIDVISGTAGVYLFIIIKDFFRKVKYLFLNNSNKNSLLR